MEFHNKLYELRKRKGLSQEELANRINVSRQTVSKWEISDSTPDMEKLIALGELFEISLDELILGKDPYAPDEAPPASKKVSILTDKPSADTEKTPVNSKFREWEVKIMTPENKQKSKKWLKIAGIIAAVILAVDVISMIVYFLFWGIPS